MRLLGIFKSNYIKREAGFSLAETVLSVLLLGLIGVTLLQAIETNYRSTRILDEQVQATNLATSYLDAIRRLSYDTSGDPYLSASDNISIPPQYIVDIDIMYSDNGTAWVDTYSGQELQKVFIIVSREGGEPVRSFCTYKIDFPGE